MVATTNILTRNQVIAYVGANAGRFNVDPAALLAVANHEGLNTAPASKWWLPKESNWSFGPPSWYGNGAGNAILNMFGGNADEAAAWSWSPEGLDYWMSKVSKVASGLTGTSAIAAIVNNFECPLESRAAGEISNASSDYAMFQQAIGTVQVPSLPAQTPAQTPARAQPSTSTQTQSSAPPTGSLLNAGQVGPFKLGVPSGLLLGLLALALLVVGAIIMAGPDRIGKVATTVVAPEAGAVG